MKKLFFALIAVSFLAACTTGTGVEETTADSTSVVVDTACVEADTATIDTVVAE